MDQQTGPWFDPEWLTALAELFDRKGGDRARPTDLYLERRVERRLARSDGGVEALEISDEGCAARWQGPNRIETTASNGLDGLALGHALAPARLRTAVPRPQSPQTPLIPPDGWEEWSHAALTRLPVGRVGVRCLVRTAAVVQPGAWAVVQTPPLVQVSASEPGSVLLAVWGHPSLDEWVDALGGKPAGAGWLPQPGTRRAVIFTEGSGGVLIHELVGHLAESDLVAAGVSPLAERLGQMVAPEQLTVVDDPTLVDLPGAFDHDDEGVPAAPRTLVDSGRLVGWLCDREGSRRLDCPSGRGRRPGWQWPPIARMSNLVTHPGTTPAAEIEHAHTRALLVTRAGAAMVDPTQGRVVIRIDAGWEILHGRRRRPLSPFHLVGAIGEVLAGIHPELGDDPTPDWRTGWCLKDAQPLPTGSLTPTFAVEGLEVL